MKAPNITPGPWRPVVPPSSSLIHREVQDEQDCVIAEFPHIGQRGVGVTEAVANAKAVSALPDLLQALEPFAACWNGDAYSSCLKAGMQISAGDLARAQVALTKAGYTFP